jgi:hypothetical protein
MYRSGEEEGDLDEAPGAIISTAVTCNSRATNSNSGPWRRLGVFMERQEEIAWEEGSGGGKRE